MRISNFATMALLMVLGPTSFAAGFASRVSPTVFLGDYKLVQTRAGMCESSFSADMSELRPGEVDLDLGSFKFSRVNHAAEVIEDDLVKMKASSYTTSNSEMIGHTYLYTKSSRSTDVNHTVARLMGDDLLISNHTHITSPDSPTMEFDTICLYRRGPKTP